jgi:hypothetical protein
VDTSKLALTFWPPLIFNKKVAVEPATIELGPVRLTVGDEPPPWQEIQDEDWPEYPEIPPDLASAKFEAVSKLTRTPKLVNRVLLFFMQASPQIKKHRTQRRT